MTQKRKTAIDTLILELRSKGILTATEFFTQARAQTWGRLLSSDEMVTSYNERLGALFGRNQLSFEEVNRAMKP